MASNLLRTFVDHKLVLSVCPLAWFSRWDTSIAFVMVTLLVGGIKDDQNPETVTNSFQGQKRGMVTSCFQFLNHQTCYDSISFFPSFSEYIDTQSWYLLLSGCGWSGIVAYVASLIAQRDIHQIELLDFCKYKDQWNNEVFATQCVCPTFSLFISVSLIAERTLRWWIWNKIRNEAAFNWRWYILGVRAVEMNLKRCSLVGLYLLPLCGTMVLIHLFPCTYSIYCMFQ